MLEGALLNRLTKESLLVLAGKLLGVFGLVMLIEGLNDAGELGAAGVPAAG